jgi:hypothetical protein
MSASREGFSRAASKAGSLRRPILFEERIRFYRLWVVLEVALGLIPELMLSAPRAPPPRPTTRVRASGFGLPLARLLRFFRREPTD